MGVCVGRVHLQQTEEPSPRGFVVCVFQRARPVFVCVCMTERDGESYKLPNTKGQKCLRFACVYTVHSYTHLCISVCPLHPTSTVVGRTVVSTGCEMLMWAAWLYVGLSHISPTQHIIIAVQRAAVKDTE